MHDLRYIGACHDLDVVLPHSSAYNLGRIVVDHPRKNTVGPDDDIHFKSAPAHGIGRAHTHKSAAQDNHAFYLRHSSLYGFRIGKGSQDEHAVHTPGDRIGNLCGTSRTDQQLVKRIRASIRARNLPAGRIYLRNTTSKI